MVGVVKGWWATARVAAKLVRAPARIPLSRLKPLQVMVCLLNTSDAADDLFCVDLGGSRISKKKIPEAAVLPADNVVAAFLCHKGIVSGLIRHL